MTNTKLSQFNQNNIQNSLYQGGGQPGGIFMGGDDGEEQNNDKEAVNIVTQIASNNGDVSKLLPGVQELLSHEFKTPGVTEKWKQLYFSLGQNSDPKKQTVDLQTGQKIPTPQEIAKELVTMFKTQMQKTASNKDVAPEDKEKKKTKGNPFRVLMGMVGTLLDHGMTRTDIIRYVKKKIKFNDGIINKAIDIVKDYNKKKRRKTSFNYNQYIKTSQKYNELYDAEPQWEKRSTAELMARLSWLQDLSVFENAADKTGVAGDIKKITNELKQRGFANNELPH